MEKLFVFDVETTGLDASRHGIHQLAVMIVIAGRVVRQEHFHIQPFREDEISLEALSISNTEVDDFEHYQAPEGVYRQLINMLDAYVDRFDKQDKMFLCGYNNLSFDNDFLRAFFRKNGDKYFSSYFFSGGLDAMALAVLPLLKTRHLMPDFRLATVAKYMGIDVDDKRLHTAAYDLVLTYEIIRKVQQAYTPA